jgi:hypothetical protein
MNNSARGASKCAARGGHALAAIEKAAEQRTHLRHHTLRGACSRMARRSLRPEGPHERGANGRNS